MQGTCKLHTCVGRAPGAKMNALHLYLPAAVHRIQSSAQAIQIISLAAATDVIIPNSAREGNAEMLPAAIDASSVSQIRKTRSVTFSSVTSCHPISVPHITENKHIALNQLEIALFSGRISIIHRQGAFGARGVCWPCRTCAWPSFSAEQTRTG